MIGGEFLFSDLHDNNRDDETSRANNAQQASPNKLYEMGDVTNMLSEIDSMLSGLNSSYIDSETSWNCDSPVVKFSSDIDSPQDFVPGLIQSSTDLEALQTHL